MAIRLSIIGKGSFGRVYLAPLNGINYALKCCAFPKDNSTEIIDKEI